MMTLRKENATIDFRTWRQDVSDEIHSEITSWDDQQQTHTISQDLGVKFTMDLMLLQKVHGVIIAAAGQGDQDPFKVFIFTQLALLGKRLQDLPPVLHALHTVEASVLEELSQSLEKVLTLLDIVVLDSVLGLDTCRPQNSSDSNLSAFPRLVALHDFISKQNRTPSAPAQYTAGQEQFSQWEPFIASRYLSFELTYDESCQLLRHLELFCKALEKLEHLTTRDMSTKMPHNDRTSDTRSHMETTVQEAQVFWKRMKVLHESLDAGIKSCDTEHTVQLCLSKLGTQRDILDISFSLCSEPSLPLWHPGTIEYSTHESAANNLKQNMPAHNLCGQLQESYKKKRPACLILSGRTITKAPASSGASQADRWRIGAYVAPQSFIDLEAVLIPIEVTNLHHQRPFKLSVARRLQCLLAQSLLLFHPSSWVPEILSLKNINFVVNETIPELKNPYILCTLHRLTVNDKEPRLGAPDISRVAESMVHFGLLLLQIQFNQPWPLEEWEEKHEYGHEFALRRCVEVFKDEIEETLYQVLMNCLKFEEYLEEDDSYGSQPLEVKIRFAILHYIFHPLAKILVCSFPNIAADILPLDPKEVQRGEDRTESRAFSMTRYQPNKKFQLDTIDEYVESDKMLPSGAIGTNKTEYAPQNHSFITQVGGTMLSREPPDWFERLGPLIAILDDPEYNSVPKRIRIAVIDSGIAENHPAYMVERYKDCIKNPRKSRAKDIEHGTASVDLILRVFDNAELYIARIFQDNYANDETEIYMRDAILWAIEQRVDIISISAGLRTSSKIVDAAINQATSGSTGDHSEILIFASAGNEGATEPVAYPARYVDRVFCMFSTDSVCKSSEAINPSPIKRAHNFAIFGDKVVLNPSMPELRGTSMATAIAAGLAGRLLDFGNHADSRRNISNISKLHTKRGMTEVFALMTKNHDRDDYECMVPWDLLPKDTQLTRLQKRQDIARKINEALSHL